MPVTEDQIDGVREKLVRLAADDPKYLRVLFFIDEEEEKYQQCGSWPPVLKTFAAALDNDTVFCQYAEKQAKKLERVELEMQDAEGHEIQNEQYGFYQRDDATRPTRQMLKCSNAVQENFEQGEQWSRSFQRVSAGEKLSEERSYVGLRWALQQTAAAGAKACLAAKTSGTVVIVGLAATSLSYDTLKIMKQWWSGEIAGKRAAKDFVDALSTTAGGVLGGIAAGAAVGAASGSVCAAIGGMVGSFLGAWGSSKLSEFLTLKLFDIPKDEALDNAYSYFGVTMHATNSQINTAFRQKCLQNHPDKGGRAEDFHITQFHMAVITLAREGPERSSLQNHLRSTQSIRY